MASDVRAQADGVRVCCASGYKDNGTPTGNVISIGGVPTYVARSTQNTGKAIVMFTDVFGWELVNARLIADAYALMGLTTYLPDCHNGDALVAETWDPVMIAPDGAGFFGRMATNMRFACSLPTMLSWFKKHGDAATLPIVKKILPAIRSEQGISKLAAIGYCWGGRYSLLAGGSILGAELEAANGQIDCFAACHPSWVTMPGDVEQVQKPGIFICAESDNIFPRKAVQQTKDITARLQKERNLPEGYWQLKQYPGTSHGFAIRGDESMPIVAEARKDVLKVTFDFFMQHL